MKMPSIIIQAIKVKNFETVPHITSYFRLIYLSYLLNSYSSFVLLNILRYWSENNDMYFKYRSVDNVPRNKSQRNQ
jgi:hypothetical protein